MKNENPVNTYIVRIYRLVGDKPRGILGTAEKVGEKGKKAFTCVDELWEILSSPTSLPSSLQGTRENRKKTFKKTGRKKGGEKFCKTDPRSGLWAVLFMFSFLNYLNRSYYYIVVCPTSMKHFNSLKILLKRKGGCPWILKFLPRVEGDF